MLHPSDRIARQESLRLRISTNPSLSPETHDPRRRCDFHISHMESARNPRRPQRDPFPHTRSPEKCAGIPCVCPRVCQASAWSILVRAIFDNLVAIRSIFSTCNELGQDGLPTLPDVPPSVCYPGGRFRQRRRPKPGGQRNLDPRLGRERVSRHGDCQHHGGRGPAVRDRSTQVKC